MGGRSPLQGPIMRHASSTEALQYMAVAMNRVSSSMRSHLFGSSVRSGGHGIFWSPQVWTLLPVCASMQSSSIMMEVWFFMVVSMRQAMLHLTFGNLTLHRELGHSFLQLPLQPQMLH